MTDTPELAQEGEKIGLPIISSKSDLSFTLTHWSLRDLSEILD